MTSPRKALPTPPPPSPTRPNPAQGLGKRPRHHDRYVPQHAMPPCVPPPPPRPAPPSPAPPRPALPSRDVLEVGEGEGGGLKGGGGWLVPPSSQGPPMVPAEGGPKTFEASILLAPKAPKQKFGSQPQTLEGEGGASIGR